MRIDKRRSIRFRSGSTQMGNLWSAMKKCPRQESNLRTRFRKALARAAQMRTVEPKAQRLGTPRDSLRDSPSGLLSRLRRRPPSFASFQLLMEQPRSVAHDVV
jgi:hypothetical protein